MFAKIDLSIDQSENNEINLAEFVEHSIASIVNQFLFGVKFDEVLFVYCCLITVII